ncbi:MAG: ribonuclease HIII [Verrucomicrobia bacterium]|nr:MAG: ribonuclease HIII [Verrucomicrobiota bacterium]
MVSQSVPGCRTAFLPLIPLAGLRGIASMASHPMAESPARNSFTAPLSLLQVEKLRRLLRERGWTFEEKEYTHYAARKDKTTVAVYQKGPKVLVQGRGTAEFVEFLLEPEILGTAQLGYEEVHQPEMFTPHFGIDESGKGDFFGPLVIAGVFTDAAIARTLMAAGVQDSKAISSDARIRQLADAIRQTPGIATEVISMGPERYNDLYGKFKNLNRLLAWGHSRVIESLLEKRPDCPRSLSDQFAHESVLRRAIGPRAKDSGMILEQRTKGESDIAVAAASILARERFIDWMDEASRRLGVKLPRGASQVKGVAGQLVAARGAEFLAKIAKTHFKTARQVLGLPELKDED